MEPAVILSLEGWSLLSHAFIAFLSALVTAAILSARNASPGSKNAPWEDAAQRLIQQGLVNSLRARLKQETKSFFLPRSAQESFSRGSSAGAAKARCDGPMAFLVGAGPGDPELLTLAAVRALEQADLVITDRLVPQAVLSYCKCRVVYSQKFKGCANIAQAQLQDWVVDGLKQGLKVVRLKGGDPFLYGRGMEEVEHILNAGFRVKVISGISSSLAAPLAAGISITARGVANKLLVATAHGKYDTYPDLPPYDPAQSTVYLMSVSRLGNLAKALIHEGYPADLPVAIVERATMPEQRAVYGTLETVGILAMDQKVVSPAVITIGAAAGQRRERAEISYEAGGVIFEHVS